MTVIHTNASLSAEFRSLYRLFLRANSAVVLHHSPSKIQVRRLWRPVFDEAALKIHRLQHQDVHPPERTHIVQWLYTWHKRVDHTLSLLATAAISRGIAHNITRNLRWLRQNHVVWVEKLYYSHKSFWKPQLPPTSAQYQRYSIPTPGSKPGHVLGKNRKMRLFDEQCSNAIGEVVKMAEGRHNVILGRLRLKRWQQEWSS
ncbi:hypothetical protein DEU56DRAFT_531178 [Suillus clintonianus]|uniref:uncharacterized protein n=1 Tax=Suillus clintonianus TaxID=1904413 RepID=UPI001B86DE58|nr:uncharacterized protein DEU56DRAFT_531178 [Suillus clintonianus]KAG2127229.1 hypothetical protein DEU56DRAFT_531178 [Suillus clintonianus]